MMDHLYFNPAVRCNIGEINREVYQLTMMLQLQLTIPVRRKCTEMSRTEWISTYHLCLRYSYCDKFILIGQGNEVIWIQFQHSRDPLSSSTYANRKNCWLLVEYPPVDCLYWQLQHSALVQFTMPPKPRMSGSKSTKSGNYHCKHFHDTPRQLNGQFHHRTRRRESSPIHRIRPRMYDNGSDPADLQTIQEFATNRSLFMKTENARQNSAPVKDF